MSRSFPYIIMFVISDRFHAAILSTFDLDLPLHLTAIAFAINMMVSSLFISASHDYSLISGKYFGLSDTDQHPFNLQTLLSRLSSYPRAVLQQVATQLSLLD